MTYAGWAIAFLVIGLLMLVYWALMLFTDMGAGVSMRMLARIGFVNLYSLMLPALGLTLVLTGSATLLHGSALLSALLMTLALVSFLAVVLSLFPVNLPSALYPERRAAARARAASTQKSSTGSGPTTSARRRRDTPPGTRPKR